MGKNFKNGWTPEQDAKLIEIVNRLKAVKPKVKMKDILEIASEEIGRPCYGRWYSVVSNNIENKGNENMNVWSDEEDRILKEIVLENIDKGKKLKDAFKIASEKLNRTFLSCRARWDEKKTFNTFERVNWSKEEDEFLIQTFRKHILSNMTIENVCEIVAKELNRTTFSCKARWSNLKFQVEKGLSESYSHYEWTEERINILCNIVTRHVSAQGTLTEAYDLAAKELNITPKMCRNKFERDKLKEKYNINIGKWSEKENDQLSKIVLIEISKGAKIDDALKTASEEIGRTKKSCRHHWYYGGVMNQYLQEYKDAYKASGRKFKERKEKVS